jgi:hypothetical protein
MAPSGRHELRSVAIDERAARPLDAPTRLYDLLARGAHLLGSGLGQARAHRRRECALQLPELFSGVSST